MRKGIQGKEDVRGRYTWEGLTLMSLLLKLKIRWMQVLVDPEQGKSHSSFRVTDLVLENGYQVDQKDTKGRDNQKKKDSCCTVACSWKSVETR